METGERRLLERFVPGGDIVGLGGEEGIGWIQNFNALNRVALADPVHDVLSGGDFAKDGVFVIQPGSGHMGDEKLTAIGGGAAIGHREKAGFVVFERGNELVAEIIAGAARSGAGGIAALNHEILDHPVEGNPVVVSALCQIEEVGGRHGSLIGKEGGGDVALVGFDDNADGSDGFAHGIFSVGDGESGGKRQSRNKDENFTEKKVWHGRNLR